MPDNSLKIFINYRRADHADFVEHMRTWFMLRYGRENVFMDFDTIPPFERFEDFIRQKIRECDVVVPIIGPRWLELLQEKETSGKPDYVRIEIEEALKHNKVIAPVCIQDAKIPPEESVPPALRPIFERNIPELKSGRDILNNIKWVMEGFEAQFQRQKPQATLSYQEIEPALATDSSSAHQFNIHEAIGRFYEAQEQGNLPAALGWLAQIRESGVIIPGFFKIEQREQEIQARLKAEEEEKRRREVAEYEYSFVRTMVKFREAPQEIQAALEQVWKVYPGYDPDNLAAHLKLENRFKENAVRESLKPRSTVSTTLINSDVHFDNMWYIVVIGWGIATFIGLIVLFLR